MSDVQTRPDPGTGTIWQLSTRTRRVLLLAPPLVLAGFTVLHPNPDHNVQALIDASTWFMGFHMIQLGLVGLAAVSVFVLADQFHRASDWQTCLGMGFFLVYFSAYDTLAGIGTGLAMKSARDLPTSQQEALFEIVQDWPALEPWVSGAPSSARSGGYSLSATWQSSLEPLGRRVRSGCSSGWRRSSCCLGHPAPFGTIAFGSLFIAALLHERRVSRLRARALPDRSRPAMTE